VNCPVDGNTLVMSERQGVEIDYCPTCRGVWLDRGELDKIIDRNEAAAPRTASAVDGRVRRDHDGRRDHDDRRRDEQWYGPKRKKRSFLSELFDD
jgi:Zn-finger nucleic acid-binding protein